MSLVVYDFFFFFLNLCYSFSDIHRRKREARVAAVRSDSSFYSAGRVDADHLVERNVSLIESTNRRARLFFHAIGHRDIFQLANARTDVYDVTRE